jgi:Ca-activated chloride channel family protein
MARIRRNIAVGLLPSGRVLAAVLVVSVIAGIAFVALSSRDEVPAGASGSAATCDGGDPLYLSADPAVAPTLSALAEQFNDAVTADDRPCVRIDVRGMSAPDVVEALLRGWDTAANGPPPDVWVPDSSAWLDVYRTESDDEALLPEESLVLARSPMVFAMPEPMADALPEATLKWRDLMSLPDLEFGWGEYGHAEWGQAQLVVADPLSSTSGLLSLLSLGVAQDEIWAGGPTGDAAINIDSDIGVLRFRRAVTAVGRDVPTLLRRYYDAEAPELEFSGLPLLEREMWLFNRGHMQLPAKPSEGAQPTGEPAPMGGQPSVKFKAIYPSEGAFGADYPFVVLNGDWVDDASVQVADEFADFLLGDTGQERFEADGFRNADNNSNPVHRPEDGLSRQLGGDIMPLPEADVISSVRRSWRNVTTPSRTLLLVDVSGSMVESATGGEQTRLEATVDAAVRGLDVLPDASEAGLWEFSTDLRGGEHGGDYRELVPTGPLDEELDGDDRRTRIVDSLLALEPQNDTALNDTAVAAYQAVLDGYQPDVRHAIILLTDGRNDDDGSISNRAVIDRLEEMQDPERPVRIVAIAYGDETDIAQLERLTAATGGKVLSSPNADDLEELFLEALAGS